MTSAPLPDPAPTTAATFGVGDPEGGAPGPEAAGAGVDHALAVLGMLAYSALAAFSRLAADAAQAPSLDKRLELSRLAGGTLTHLDLITARAAELGAELRPVMAPYAGVLVEFDERTAPATWWERLIKAYVGYGVADDFGRIVAQALDPRTRDVAVAVLTDEGHAQLVVDSLAEAVARDATLASRLALWGRRLFGEALNVVQQVVAEHPDLRDLLEIAMADAPGSGDAQQKVFAVLTGEHSRRMERLGLTP